VKVLALAAVVAAFGVSSADGRSRAAHLRYQASMVSRLARPFGDRERASRTAPS